MTWVLIKVLLLPSFVALGKSPSVFVSEGGGGVDPQGSAGLSFPRLPLPGWVKKADFEEEDTSGFFWILAEFPEGLQMPVRWPVHSRTSGDVSCYQQDPANVPTPTTASLRRSLFCI